MSKNNPKHCLQSELTADWTNNRRTHPAHSTKPSSRDRKHKISRVRVRNPTTAGLNFMLRRLFYVSSSKSPIFLGKKYHTMPVTSVHSPESVCDALLPPSGKKRYNKNAAYLCSAVKASEGLIKIYCRDALNSKWLFCWSSSYCLLLWCIKLADSDLSAVLCSVFLLTGLSNRVIKCLVLRLSDLCVHPWPEVSVHLYCVMRQ